MLQKIRVVHTAHIRPESSWTYWSCRFLKAESSLLANHCRRLHYEEGRILRRLLQSSCRCQSVYGGVAPCHFGEAGGDAADGAHMAEGGVEMVGEMVARGCSTCLPRV